MNFLNQWNYFLALGPQAILTAFAIGILLFGVSKDNNSDEHQGWLLGRISLAGVIAAGIVNAGLYPFADRLSDGIVAVDRYALFSNWVLLLGSAMAILISISYVEKQRIQVPEYFALLLFSTVGLMLMTASLDLMLVFIGLEIASISVYALASIDQRSPKGSEAGLKYFLLGAFSTGIFLYGVALIYGSTGSANLTEILNATVDADDTGVMLITGVIMLAVGFCFKVGVVPFHMWTPDVYQGSPMPITGYMSVAIKAGAFFTFYRIFGIYLDNIQFAWATVFWWLALLTMIGANLVALVQNNVKRLLAYSGIAHSGYLLITVLANNTTSESGLLYYLAVYTVANMGLFAGFVVVANHSEHQVEVSDYAGLGNKQPFIAMALTVFLLSLGGFPATGGFIGKILILRGALEDHYLSLAIALVISTLISYWYYLRLAWFMWMKDQDETSNADKAPKVKIPLVLKLVLALSLVLIVYAGIFPSQLIGFIETSLLKG